MSRRRRREFNTTFFLCCLAMSGCGETSSSEGAPSRTDPAVQQARGEALERKQLDRVPPEPAARVEGEVPDDLMNRVREHLAQRTGAAAGTFEVVRAQWQEWPNGAMGCPQPGVNYTQAMVRGYWIVLKQGGREYDYRVSESGHFVLCEGMTLDQPPTT